MKYNQGINGRNLNDLDLNEEHHNRQYNITNLKLIAPTYNNTILDPAVVDPAMPVPSATTETINIPHGKTEWRQKGSRREETMREKEGSGRARGKTALEKREHEERKAKEENNLERKYREAKEKEQ